MPKVASMRIQIRVKFRAPLPFVFGWCTDYGAGDAKLERGTYTRRVLSRSDHQVVYEDLDSTPAGWRWMHWTVRLRPPDAWHGEAVGNYRNWVTDYRLRETSDGGTELTLTGTRTPTGLGVGGPSVRRAEVEKMIGDDWKRFSRALESDYRKSQKRSTKRRPG